MPGDAYVACSEGYSVDHIMILDVMTEKWTSNPLWGKKFIMGKLVFQKDPISSDFFARGFYMDDQLVLSQTEEPLDSSSLLPECLKDLDSCPDILVLE